MQSSTRFVDSDQFDWCVPYAPLGEIPEEVGATELSRRLYPVERVMYLPVLVIGDCWMRLRQILKIEVDPGDDYAFVMFAPSIGVGGVGDTLPDAVRSLSENAIALWEELRSTPESELHHTAQARLNRLRAFIAE